MFSDEIVSCYKDPAELVLFHDVEMKGHIREGSIRWKLVRVFQDRSLLHSKRAATCRLSLEPTKTKLVEFGRFAHRHANKRGCKRPETIYFLGFTLYCTRNQKGNFRIGMLTGKSRLRRALMRLQDQTRRMRHLPLQEQANHLNQMLRGHFWRFLHLLESVS